MSAILDAATRVLNQDQDAAMADIARAAGVTRQTVYAHYPTRQILLDAVIDHLTADLATLLAQARPHEGPPAQALTRLLDIGWELVDRYPLLLRLSESSSPHDSQQRHQPVLTQFENLILRGQHSGDFDPDVPAAWLTTAAVALTDTAAAHLATSRLTPEQARTLSRQAILRVLRPDPPNPTTTRPQTSGH